MWTRFLNIMQLKLYREPYIIIGTIAKCMRIILDIFIGSDPEIRHSGYQRVVATSLPVFICISDAGHDQYDENDCAYSKKKFHGDPFITITNTYSDCSMYTVKETKKNAVRRRKTRWQVNYTIRTILKSSQINIH